MPSKLLSSIVKRARQFLFALREREPVTIDECVLEHMLLYHGLVGSSPENGRELKDVRADILQAIDSGSSDGLSIALKLAPLWWEDKLAAIFSQLNAQKRERAIELLVAGNAKGLSSERPLHHEDWRVRSNAAIILAFLKAESAAGELADLLDDTSDSGKMAFCHIARSLGSLTTEEGKLALARHLNHPESWFRVDVAGALSFYPLASSGHFLAQALKESELKDYVAIAISRKHKPQEFLISGEESVINAGCELVIGILEAANNTFKNDVVFDTGADQCLEALLKLTEAASTPLRVTATLNLLDWLLDKASKESTTPAGSTLVGMPASVLKSKIDQITASYLKTEASSGLRVLAMGRAQSSEELKYAIYLSGRLKIVDSETVLISLLKPDCPFLSQVIDALGQIGLNSSAAPLLKLANQTVDIHERIIMPKSKQPVLEERASAAKTFWRILKALGNFDSPDCVKFLTHAAADYAPDKRAQALSSLVAILRRNASLSTQVEVDGLLLAGLHDPSPIVQLVAIKGAASLGMANAIPEIARLTDAHENTVSKEAFSALSELSKKGHSTYVSELLEPKLKTQRELHKKRQIEELLLAKNETIR